MTRLLALGVVFLTVLVSGAAAGLWHGRWGESKAVHAAAARLERLPLSLGENWDVQETALSELAGALSRSWRSRGMLRAGISTAARERCSRSSCCAAGRARCPRICPRSASP